MTRRLDAARARALNSTLYHLYDDLAEPLSLQRVVQALTHLMPAMSFSAIEIHRPPRQPVTRIQHNLDGVGDFAGKIARLGHQHPAVLELRKKFHPALRLSDLVTQRQFRQTAIYHEIYRRLSGFRDHAAMVTRLPGYQLGFALNRDTLFADEDLLLLELLQPHLERILQRAAHYLNLPANPPLTPREREVLHWLAEGKRDAEIALILGTALRTVEQHVRTILRKMGVETRTAAAAIAWRARGGFRKPEPAGERGAPRLSAS